MWKETVSAAICQWHQGETMASTLYWCDTCDIPIFENVCPSCGTEGKYIATDVRPEFPEENALISLIIGDNPTKLNKLPLFH